MRIPAVSILLFVYVASVMAKIKVIDRRKQERYHIEKVSRYRPDWDDLDKRPLPEWYDRAKVGIFLHWGVFSVPSFGSEWFWSHVNENGSTTDEFMKKNYPPGFTYQEFAPMFTAEFFNPDKWAKLFVRSGAKYVVLTTKHHEGFTLYPSKRSFSWNAFDVGPRRDLVKELSVSVRNNGLKFGAYHSLYEWFNPIYLEDQNAGFKTREYPDTKLFPDLKQLVNDYNPSVLWVDGDWEADDVYWNSTGFLAWLYNDSPVKEEVVVNDRWGKGLYGLHGDFYNFADRFNNGTLQKHKWENAFTVDKESWGYRREMELDDIMTIEQLLKEVVSSVSCGGNALINVGPTKEGTIPLIFQDRLKQLGTWLSINGEGIYDTSPWHHQMDTVNKDAWYTCTKTPYDPHHPTDPPKKTDNVTAIYAILLKWPADNTVKLHDIAPTLQKYKVQLLGNRGDYLDWKIEHGEAFINLPDRETVSSQYAWTLMFTRTFLS